ncbi:MAG: 16S rRNA (guanine(527)-N(7))-methyltransferase RsmG [Vitreoscilla sp.]
MPLDHDEPSRLDGRLEALAPRLGLALSATERRQLLAYMAMIQRWTKVYNLTAVRDTGQMFTHHLLDCLAVVAPLRQGSGEAGQGALRVLDVGSGAGLPGVILAMLNPAWQVTCVDAVAKKAAFIRQAAAELSLPNLHGVHGRVEAKGTFKAPEFDLVTSRAFASIHDFTALTRPLLAPHGQWAAMKANLAAEERAAVPHDVEMFHVEQLEVPDLNENRCLVWLRPRLPADQTARKP